MIINIVLIVLEIIIVIGFAYGVSNFSYLNGDFTGVFLLPIPSLILDLILVVRFECSIVSAYNPKLIWKIVFPILLFAGINIVKFIIYLIATAKFTVR